MGGGKKHRSTYFELMILQLGTKVRRTGCFDIICIIHATA